MKGYNKLTARHKRRHDELLHHYRRIEKLGVDLLKHVEEFQQWYTFKMGQLAHREIDLVAGNEAFILEKASWDIEEDKKRAELSALDVSLSQWKISQDAHEEELQARECNLTIALHGAEGKFQAELASQVEEAHRDKGAALCTLSNQHRSKLGAATVEEDCLAEVARDL